MCTFYNDPTEASFYRYTFHLFLLLTIQREGNARITHRLIREVSFRRAKEYRVIGTASIQFLIRYKIVKYNDHSTNTKKFMIILRMV